MARSHQQWNPNLTHVDIEQAFLDRTALAVEVRSLRSEMAEHIDAVTLADTEAAVREIEIEELIAQVKTLNARIETLNEKINNLGATTA